MKYFIIAGEASGDLHGSGLVRELHHLDPAAEIRCWGGDRMEAAGATVLKHYKELAFMGFAEVLANLPVILRNFRLVKTQILAFDPDVLVLIDYPGFNLRMSKWAKSNDIPVHYYISPQLWAWKERRVEIVRDTVDEMYVILPFEQEWYSRRSVDVTYVGHPLLEAVDRFRKTLSSPVKADSKYIALLPGSRRQEIDKMLPVALEVASTQPKLAFVIAMAPHIDRLIYERHLGKSGATNVALSEDGSYHVLSGAHAAITTSGTATLETALFGIPQVVCYKGSALSFEIAKRLVKVPYISLVNLIAGKPVVEELIQENVNPSRLNKALENILSDEIRQFMMDEYGKLYEKLDAGGASRLTAQRIYRSVSNGQSDS